MIKCTVCGVEQTLASFEAGRRQCRTCRALVKLKTKATWYAKNAAEAVVYAREWRERNEERRYELRCAEYWKDPVAARTATKVYGKNNVAKTREWGRAYQAAKRQRAPKWLDADDRWLLAQAYELAVLRTKITGFVWHVDHIIPLRGKLVSGLHVPLNLQVIPATANMQKRNRYPVTVTTS